MSRFFTLQGLRRSAANLADRIGEIAFANFSSRVSAQALRHGGKNGYKVILESGSYR